MTIPRDALPWIEGFLTARRGRTVRLSAWQRSTVQAALSGRRHTSLGVGKDLAAAFAAFIAADSGTDSGSDQTAGGSDRAQIG